MPGDKYQLVFVTQGTRDANSANIADYNAFVQTQAALNAALTGTDVGVNWYAIGSTPTVDAKVNAVVGANTPVYLLDGTTKVVDGFSDMWNFSIDAAINVDQFNQAAAPALVWTGSLANGTGANMFELGANTNSVVKGDNQQTSAFWIYNGSSNPNNMAPLYALSGELTVPNPVPEPATAVTFAIGVGLLVLSGLRRWRK